MVSQKYYILFAQIVDGSLRAYKDDDAGAVADWTEENEAKVWRGLGKCESKNFSFKINIIAYIQVS